ncbi:unnamed protein product [Linum trigynum]|uniref:Uncharacterized protein n=1 Tax=Linum trigynum TaxID=586398 RepID=A0AAV2E5Q3_9ROSI
MATAFYGLELRSRRMMNATPYSRFRWLKQDFRWRGGLLEVKKKISQAKLEGRTIFEGFLARFFWNSIAAIKEESEGIMGEKKLILL